MTMLCVVGKFPRIRILRGGCSEGGRGTGDGGEMPRLRRDCEVGGDEQPACMVELSRSSSRAPRRARMAEVGSPSCSQSQPIEPPGADPYTGWHGRGSGGPNSTPLSRSSPRFSAPITWPIGFQFTPLNCISCSSCGRVPRCGADAGCRVRLSHINKGGCAVIVRELQLHDQTDFLSQPKARHIPAGI